MNDGNGSSEAAPPGVEPGKARVSRISDALKRRPVAVKVAVGCLLANVVASVLTIFAANLKDQTESRAVMVMVVALLLMLRLIYGIYWGSQWARWFVVAWVGVCVWCAPGILASLESVQDWCLYLALSALLLVATMMLLLPKVGRWFKEVRLARRG